MANIITKRYTTNHPNDRAAREMTKARDIMKNESCTHRELRNPTQANVEKCKYEMSLSRDVRRGKSAARSLGEDSNLEKYRRR